MDSYVLTGPQGSSINVGSILRGDQTQDYGSAGLLKSTLVDNTFVDGAVLSYEHAGARTWNFSVLLASGAIGALDDIARQLRQIARPGATLDIQVDGVASANVVRWDVIAGRVEEQYDLAVQRAGRRKAMISLDTQPYGYLPTWIILASAASVGNPGTLTIPGGSIIGDVPGFAEFVIGSASQTIFFAGEPTLVQDSVLWSGANKAGGVAWWPAGSLISQGVATLFADSFSPGASHSLRSVLTSGQLGWTGIGYIAIPSGLEASMRGRWRAFAFAAMNSASSPYAALISADVVAAANAGAAMGSGGPIATLPTPRFALSDGANQPVPTGQVLLDLGEITIPPTGSGIDQDVRIRLWANASWPAGPATIGVDIGGVFLLDLDGPAGILPRGLGQPSTIAPTVGRFVIESYYRRAMVAQATGSLAPYVPQADVLGLYRGQMPYAHPSQTKIDFLVADHRQTRRYTTEILQDIPVAWYRMTETAGPTMIDSSGVGNHGAYVGTPSLTASSLTISDAGIAGAAAFLGASQYGFAAVAAGLPAGNAPRAFEAWFQIATFISGGNFIAAYGSPSTNRELSIKVVSTAIRGELFGIGGPDFAYQFQVGQTYHAVINYGGTAVGAYINGVPIGTSVFAGIPSTVSAGAIVGALSGQSAAAIVDEVAVYTSALSDQRIMQHYLAGKSAYGATSPPISTPQVLTASYRYRPRFGFSRGL